MSPKQQEILKQLETKSVKQLIDGMCKKKETIWKAAVNLLCESGSMIYTNDKCRNNILNIIRKVWILHKLHQSENSEREINDILRNLKLGGETPFECTDGSVGRFESKDGYDVLYVNIDTTYNCPTCKQKCNGGSYSKSEGSTIFCGKYHRWKVNPDGSLSKRDSK